MTDHVFTVTVSGCTREQAEQVMAERLGYDEDYGFPYSVRYENYGSSVCPLCGGDVTVDSMPYGMFRCITCAETLYFSELVPLATVETREAYYEKYPDSRPYPS